MFECPTAGKDIWLMVSTSTFSFASDCGNQTMMTLAKFCEQEIVNPLLRKVIVLQ